jgi:endoglucanase
MTSAMLLVGQLSLGGRLLPPDWAQLSAGGVAQPEPAPNGSQSQAQYGPDAARTVVWFAASGDLRARALAARWWLVLRSGRRSGALALGLDGALLKATPAGLSLVASAAAAKAAGDGKAATRLLRQAVALQRTYPTYYGGAWAGLGPAMLTSGALSAFSPKR